jgi:modulator of FtsH protease
MNDNIQTVDYYVLPTAERNRVVRNTYWLLAISMLPTVLGAWLGVSTGLGQAFSGVMGMILMMAGAFGFIYAIERTKESATGVYVLLGFTFFMGIVLSRMIAMVLGFKNGAELVMTAFAGTAGVFFVMASLASVIKRDLTGMAKWLMVGVVVLMVGSIINMFVGSSAGMMVISMLSMAIFSETNYISATLTLYLDVINVFQSLLALLGIFGGERE